MRSNRFLSFAIAACMSLAAGFTATAVSVGAAIAATALRCWDTITAWAWPPANQVPKSPGQTRPVVALVIARSYAERLLRRVRPNVTTGWRMCPSA